MALTRQRVSSLFVHNVVRALAYLPESGHHMELKHKACEKTASIQAHGYFDSWSFLHINTHHFVCMTCKWSFTFRKMNCIRFCFYISAVFIIHNYCEWCLTYETKHINTNSHICSFVIIIILKKCLIASNNNELCDLFVGNCDFYFNFFFHLSFFTAQWTLECHPFYSFHYILACGFFFIDKECWTFFHTVNGINLKMSARKKKRKGKRDCMIICSKQIRIV